MVRDRIEDGVLIRERVMFHNSQSLLEVKGRGRHPDRGFAGGWWSDEPTDYTDREVVIDKRPVIETRD